MTSGRMMQDEIIAYIPQRAPFVMVDEVVQADEKLSKTTFEIRENHLFVQDGYFTEPGLVENMAQTAAAGTGYKYQMAGETVPIGFIGALKNLKINKLPAIGDILETEIEILHKVLSVYVVASRVFVRGELMASCEMKIFEQSET